MKHPLIVTLCAMSALVATSAHAQFAKAEDAIKYRKAGFTLMATHFGRLGAMAQGKLPFDAKLAAQDADVLAVVAKLPYAGFTEGSDKGQTRASPDIWLDGEKFKTLAQKNQTEVGKLVAAARSGNLDAIKAAFGPAAKSCKACHEDFRKD